jgi:hypothetical protein
VATIVLAVLLFIASLGSIAVFNPGVGSRAALDQAQQITVVQPGRSQSLLLPPPRVTAMQPLLRTRGS